MNIPAATLTTIVNYTSHPAYTPTIWDTVVLILLETTCAVFLLLTIFWLPLSDWLMRRRERKRAEYMFKLRQMYGRKYETSGSKWHGRN
jgi:antibiotic biosynthesis monooxygenase (ABM) superfamily enzyme